MVLQSISHWHYFCQPKSEDWFLAIASQPFCQGHAQYCVLKRVVVYLGYLFEVGQLKKKEFLDFRMVKERKTKVHVMEIITIFLFSLKLVVKVLLLLCFTSKLLSKQVGLWLL